MLFKLLLLPGQSAFEAVKRKEGANGEGRSAKPAPEDEYYPSLSTKALHSTDVTIAVSKPDEWCAVRLIVTMSRTAACWTIDDKALMRY